MFRLIFLALALILALAVSSFKFFGFVGEAEEEEKKEEKKYEKKAAYAAACQIHEMPPSNHSAIAHDNQSRLLFPCK